MLFFCSTTFLALFISMQYAAGVGDEKLIFTNPTSHDVDDTSERELQTVPCKLLGFALRQLDGNLTTLPPLLDYRNEAFKNKLFNINAVANGTECDNKKFLSMKLVFDNPPRSVCRTSSFNYNPFPVFDTDIKFPAGTRNVSATIYYDLLCGGPAVGPTRYIKFNVTDCDANGTYCLAGSTCNGCCNTAFNALGTQCGGVCYGNGYLCKEGTTCNFCCNGSYFSASKSSTVCGSDPCWSDGTICGKGITCSNCCSKSSYWYGKAFSACGVEPCWGTGTTCLAGTSCNRCCNGSSWSWSSFANKCK